MKAAYIHIPFCTNICSYCDFSKVFYHKKWVLDYLNVLNFEIKNNYQGEVLDTIYIGGGTPSSLELEELEQLFQILNQFKVSRSLEYTIECNLENLTKEKILLFKKYGINRLSVGIQTFQDQFLKFLNRKKGDIKLIDFAKQIGISNINIDLIYALPNQTLEDLKKDLNTFLNLDITHISTYSLMIEPHTILYNKNIMPIDEEMDVKMYHLICETLEKYGFQHYETSNFSKPGFESKHNLTYWNNEYYYGFGLGASGYKEHIRYSNTRSITKYLNKEFIQETEILTKQDEMSYEMILGLRKLEGVDLNHFYEKFHKQVEEVFDIIDLIKAGKLIKNNHYLKIAKDYLYVSNDILIRFVGD